MQFKENAARRRSEANFGMASLSAVERLEVAADARGRPEPQQPLLRLPFDRIENHAVRFVAWVLARYGHEARVVQHPCRTYTCAEKARLIDDFKDLYACYGPIKIAQGTLLEAHEKHQPVRYLVYVHDGAERINYKLLKEECQVSKKGDIRMFKASSAETRDREVQELIGLEPGSVSPFVSPWSRVSAIRFDAQLVQAQYREPRTLYDFAFAQDKSLLVEPAVLLYCLRHHPFFHGLIAPFPSGSPPAGRRRAMPDSVSQQQ